MPPKRVKSQESIVNIGRGFTLVELLVVIAIIAILTAIAIITFSSVGKNSRDNKRKSDINVIRSALEQYHSDLGYYPEAEITPGVSITNCTGGPPGVCLVSKTYLNNVPADPQAPAFTYTYTAYPDSPACDNTAVSAYCTNYCLYATMEETSNGNGGANLSPCTPTGSVYKTTAP